MAVNKIDDSTIERELSGNSKVIIKYYADWCGSCKLIAPKFRRLSEDERFSGYSFLEVNAEENEKARKLAGVDNLPFFATFKDGKLVEGKATSKEDKIVELLDAIK